MVLRTLFCSLQNVRRAICTRSLTNKFVASLHLIIWTSEFLQIEPPYKNKKPCIAELFVYRNNPKRVIISFCKSQVRGFLHFLHKYISAGSPCLLLYQCIYHQIHFRADYRGRSAYRQGISLFLRLGVCIPY